MTGRPETALAAAPDVTNRLTPGACAGGMRPAGAADRADATNPRNPARRP